jgi:hypothetical protein
VDSSVYSSYLLVLLAPSDVIGFDGGKLGSVWTNINTQNEQYHRYFHTSMHLTRILSNPNPGTQVKNSWEAFPSPPNKIY